MFARGLAFTGRLAVVRHAEGQRGGQSRARALRRANSLGQCDLRRRVGFGREHQ